MTLKAKATLFFIMIFLTFFGRYFYEAIRNLPFFNFFIYGPIVIASYLISIMLYYFLEKILKFSPLNYSSKITEFRKSQRVNYLLKNIFKKIIKKGQKPTNKEIMNGTDEIISVMKGEMKWDPAKRIGLIFGVVLIIIILFTSIAMNVALLCQSSIYQGVEPKSSFFDYFYITTLAIIVPGSFSGIYPSSLWSCILVLTETLSGVIFLLVVLEFFIVTILEERREARDIIHTYLSSLC